MAEPRSPFTTTPWTIVNAAQAEGGPDIVHAHISELCRIYWPAVYAFLRRSGRNEHDAAEITQGFFSDVVLHRDLFLRARKDHGRLRSWLLKSLKNYEIDLQRKASGAAKALPISDNDVAALETSLRLSQDTTPSGAFEFQWATEVLNEAMRRTKRHFEKTKQEEKWLVFEEQVLTPIRSGNQPARQAQIAQSLGLESSGAVASAAFSVRQHLRLRIEAVIAETNAPEDRQDELEYLLSQLNTDA